MHAPPVGISTGGATSPFWAVIGLVGTMLILDIGMSRSLAAFDYALASMASKASIPGLMLKSVAVFLMHPLALLLLLAALAMLAGPGTRRPVAVIAAVSFLMAGFAGMVATMGWQGEVGQQALPFMAVLLLALAQRTRSTGGAAVSADGASLAHLFAFLSVLAFGAPLLAQTILSGAFALSRVGVIEVTHIPVDRYLAWSEDFVTPDGRTVHAGTSRPDQFDAAIAHLDAGKVTNVGVQYVQLVEGIRLLQGFEDIADRGIGGDFGAITFALGARPVSGFPPWVQPSAPELAPGRPLPDEIDLLMLPRYGMTATSVRLKENMGDQFVICRSSALWVAYARTNSAIEQCADAARAAS